MSVPDWGTTGCCVSDVPAGAPDIAGVAGAARTLAARAAGGASTPEAILACTSGSSSRSFHMRLTTSAVTTIPTMHAGRVIARICVSPRL
jgi:hypothetical protein